MQYRVKLYDNTGATALKTFSDAGVSGWSKRINAPGKAAFWLPARSASYTTDNLQKYRRIRIERRRRDGSGEWDVVWYGYIEAHRRIEGNRIGVVCSGMLKILTKRFCDLDQAFTLGGSAVASALVSQANAVQNTGIIFGDGGVTTAKTVTMQGRVDMLRALEQVAAATGGEFQVTDGGELDFTDGLGADATTTVLRFRRDGKPGSNLRDALEGEDGEPLVNRLHCASTNGGTYTANDPVSQAKYGILEGFKQFNEAQNSGTLTSMGDALVSQLANPITDFQALPIMAEKKFSAVTGGEAVSGMQYGDVNLGDLITAEIYTENQTITGARRVAEIIVSVDEHEDETLQLTLSKAGVYLTGAYLAGDEVGQLKRRIQEIEGVLA